MVIMFLVASVPVSDALNLCSQVKYWRNREGKTS